MNDNDGYVLIHRRMLNNPICCKSAYHIAVWVCLIISVTHEERKTIYGTIKPGQCFMSLRDIEKQSKVPKSTVDRILKEFEKAGQIGTDRQCKKTLITLNNWDKYQRPWDNVKTENGTVQTQKIKEISKKNGTDYGTTYNKKDNYINELENLFDEIMQNFAQKVRTEIDKDIFFEYINGIKDGNEKINAARRISSALNKLPEQEISFAEFMKKWKN